MGGTVKEGEFRDGFEGDFLEGTEDFVSSGGVDAFIEIEDNEVQGGEMNVSFSPDDLYIASMKALAEDDTDDLQELADYQEKLAAMGYRFLDGYDYEVLTALEKRGECFANEKEEIMTFVNEITDSFDTIRELYADSKASLQVTDLTERTDSLRNTALRMPQGFNRSLYMSAFNIIMDILVKGRTPAEEEVYLELLRNSPVLDGSAEFKQDEIIQFIRTLIPNVVKSYTKDQKSLSYRAEQRHNMAYLVFPNERRFMKEFQDIGVDNLAFIRQVKQKDKDYSIVCPTCGGEISLGEDFLSIIAFPSEKGSEKTIFPRPVRCRCGSGFIFTKQDYLKILKSYLNRNSMSITNFIHSSVNFCKGASFLRISPPLGIISDAVPEIVYTSDDSPLMPARIEEQNEERISIVPIDDIAFKEAVRQFYFKLKGYRLPGDKKGGVTAEYGYKELAYYFCECLSLDYRSTKNRALFSLISYLNENKHIQQILDGKRLYSLKNCLQLLETNLGSLEKVPYEKFVELASLNQVLGGSYSIAKDSVNGRKLLYSSLMGRVDNLKGMIERLESDRELVLSGLEENCGVLGFCKILNIATFKLNDLDSMLSDSRILRLFDSVTDMMIVNNFAGDFFECWVRLRFVRKNAIKGHLIRNAGQVKMMNGITKSMCKIFDSLGVYYREQDVSDKISVCYLMSMDMHKCLYDLNHAYNDLNFYQFCENFLKIPSDLQLFMGDAYADRFFRFITEFDSTAQETVKVPEYEFFLKDFSHEELESAKTLVSGLSFHRYVLKRMDDESIEDYVKRWNATPYYEFYQQDVYDNLQMFDRLVPWIPEIITSTLLYAIDYHSYATATFIVVLVRMLLESGADNALWALGVSKDHLTIIQNSLEDYMWDPQKFGCSVAEDTFCFLNGYFFSSASSAINALCSNYENVIVGESYDLCKKKELFNLEEELCSILNHGSYLDENGDAVNDEEEITEEILLYVKDAALRRLVNGER